MIDVPPKIVTCSFCLNQQLLPNKLYAVYSRRQKVKEYRYNWDTGTEDIIWGLNAEQSAIKNTHRILGFNTTFNKLLQPVFTQLNDVEWRIFPVVLNLESVDEKVVRRNTGISWLAIKDFPTPLHPAVAEVIRVYSDTLSKPSSL